MHNRRYTHSHRAAPLLSAEQTAELAAAVRGPAPEGDEWTGRTVAEWMSRTLARPVSVQLGWAYLVRLDGKRRKPRPRHGLAATGQHAPFKNPPANSHLPHPPLYQRPRRP